MIKLSVVIITFNEEKNIERCLKSVQGIADEIVVVDSFSTDRTEEICHTFDVKFISQKWLGYSAQKNLGNNSAAHEYILSMDADEALSEELKTSILAIKNNGFTGAYSMNRMVNYCGSWIKHSSWYPDKKTRIWNKDEGKWVGEIHENIQFKENVAVTHLAGDILHYSYYSVNDHLVQLEKFSSISSTDMFKTNRKAPLHKLVISPFAAFLKEYVVGRGFLDGYYGFVIAILSSYSTFLKYLKLRELYSHER